MGGLTDRGREFWQGVLRQGGSTTVPRWAAEPVPGVAEHRSPLPDGLLGAARRLAAEERVPLGDLLLAAHARVLSALTAETDVVAGYAVDGRVLPCPLTTAAGSWRGLLHDTCGVAARVRTHAEQPVERLRGELATPGPSYETVLHPDGVAADLPAGGVLDVGLVEDSGPPALAVRHRTDLCDAGAAARIAGYHLTALTLMAADPDTDHGGACLLSGEELHFQLHGLAGPHRELPDRRAHELFEDRVRAHPDAVAAVHGSRTWTYAELNARANRLGRALLARGLRREDPVAVVAERDLDWMAAVLAVLKAGGAYLPVEPHFPAGRIAGTLRRAGCRLVVTEAGSTGALDEALETLTGVEVLLVDAGYAEDHADGDLGTPVSPDQLAYIYFTSGSTGEPKGAMCEHAGLLNHLHAKLDDLQIGAGQAVAQTAPQCFDISLWQLLAGLLVGARTVLVGQETILDVPRFVDELAEQRVGVLQVVPSYLDAVVSHLEQHPRPLPDLRFVSVTGEALKQELVQRWFAVRPGTRLVNAYGLTETSDDTNHEVMDRPPGGDRVPLGRPVCNVRVHVVDGQLNPVPLGAPGLIVFSGICVGRGYVNDPERTREAYLADPHRPGSRLYRGGDYGRWLPDGKLEFLGRRDAQVKISGFRIELGEIENALLTVPGVRDGAVVVHERVDGSRRLVAFCAAESALDPGVLRDRLRRSLPEYMLPAAYHWLPSLPLTANSKVDRKALTALAAAVDALEDAAQPPATRTEAALATAWAQVLGVGRDEVGRRDNFFDRGGTSLSAVKLAVATDRAVSLKDVVEHPVLADLAALVDERGGAHLTPTGASRVPAAERSTRCRL